MDPTEANFVVLERKFTAEIAELRAELRLEQAAALQRNDYTLVDELAEALRQSEELLDQLRHLRRVAQLVATTPGRGYLAEEVDALRYFGFNPAHAVIQQRGMMPTAAAIVAGSPQPLEPTRPERILHQTLSPQRRQELTRNQNSSFGSAYNNNNNNNNVSPSKFVHFKDNNSNNNYNKSPSPHRFRQNGFFGPTSASTASSMAGVQAPHVGVVVRQYQPIRVSAPRDSSPPSSSLAIVPAQMKYSPTRNGHNQNYGSSSSTAPGLVLPRNRTSPSSSANSSPTRRNINNNNNNFRFQNESPSPLARTSRFGNDNSTISPQKTFLQQNGSDFVPLISPAKTRGNGNDEMGESETDPLDDSALMKERRNNTSLLTREKTAEMISSQKSPIASARNNNSNNSKIAQESILGIERRVDDAVSRRLAKAIPELAADERKALARDLQKDILRSDKFHAAVEDAVVNATTMTSVTSPKKRMTMAELVNSLREDNLSLHRQVALMQQREKNGQQNQIPVMRKTPPRIVTSPVKSPRYNSNNNSSNDILARTNKSAELRQQQNIQFTNQALVQRVQELEEANEKLTMKISNAARAVGQLAGGGSRQGTNQNNKPLSKQNSSMLSPNMANSSSDDDGSSNTEKNNNYSPSTHLRKAVASLDKICQQGYSALSAAKFLRAPNPRYQVFSSSTSVDDDVITTSKTTSDALFAFADKLEEGVKGGVPKWVGVAPFIVDPKRGYAHSITGISVNLVGSDEDNLRNVFDIALSVYPVSNQKKVQNNNNQYVKKESPSQQQLQQHHHQQVEDEYRRDPILSAVASGAQWSASRNRNIVEKLPQQQQQHRESYHYSSSRQIHHDFLNDTLASTNGTLPMMALSSSSSSPVPISHLQNDNQYNNNDLSSTVERSAKTSKWLRPSPEQHQQQQPLAAQYLAKMNNTEVVSSSSPPPATTKLTRKSASPSQQHYYENNYDTSSTFPSSSSSPPPIPQNQKSQQQQQLEFVSSPPSSQYYSYQRPPMTVMPEQGASPSLELATLQRLQEERDALRELQARQQQEKMLLLSSSNSQIVNGNGNNGSNINNSVKMVTNNPPKHSNNNSTISSTPSSAVARKPLGSNVNSSVGTSQKNSSGIVSAPASSSSRVRSSSQTQNNNNNNNNNTVPNISGDILSRIGPEVLRNMTPAEIEVLKRVALTQQLREDRRRKELSAAASSLPQSSKR